MIRPVDFSLAMAKDYLGDDGKDISTRLRTSEPTEEFLGEELILAAGRGDTDYVAKLLANRNVNLNYHNEQLKDGATSLFVASENGHHETVRLLIEQDATVDLPLENGFTALFISSLNGHQQIVNTLLEAHSAVDVVSKDGSTPLIAACEAGQVGVVRSLLRWRADVNKMTEAKWTALMHATRSEHLEVVNALLSHDKLPDLNCQSLKGKTALGNAAGSGSVEIVKLLLDSKANVNVANKTGWTPLCTASREGHSKIVELLLHRNAEVGVTCTNGSTPLKLAAASGSKDTVQILIIHRADVNGTAETGWSPLCSTAHKGHVETLKVLIEHKADVNFLHKNGYTPLSIGVEHPEIIECLLKNDANPMPEEHTDAEEVAMSPLIFSVEKNCRDSAKLLLKYNANINSVNHLGLTSLLLSSKMGNLEMMKMLLHYKADITGTAHNGWSVLHYAADQGNLEIVRYLLKKKIDMNVMAKVADASCENGHAFAFLTPKSIQCGFVCNSCSTPYKSDKNRYHCGHCLYDICESCWNDLKDQDGSTPVLRAALKKHIETATLLVQSNVDLSTTNRDNVSMLDVACALSQSEEDHKLLDDVKRRFEHSKAELVNPQKISNTSQLLQGPFSTDFSADYEVRPKDYRVVFPNDEVVKLKSPINIRVIFRIPRFTRGQNQWFELEVLQSIPAHKNILTLLGICTSFQHNDKTSIAIMLPYKQSGSLRAHVDQCGSLSFKRMLSFAIEMAHGIKHMHDHGYHHNDISLRNFLLCSEDGVGGIQQLTISDFGLARTHGFVHNSTTCFPWRWCAPELMASRGTVSNIGTDIWQLGVAFWEMMGALLPFGEFHTPAQILAELQKSEVVPLSFPDSCPDPWKRLIRKCCRLNPDERPKTSRIIRSLVAMLEAAEEEELEEAEYGDEKKSDSPRTSAFVPSQSGICNDENFVLTYVPFLTKTSDSTKNQTETQETNHEAKTEAQNITTSERHATEPPGVQDSEVTSTMPDFPPHRRMNTQKILSLAENDLVAKAFSKLHLQVQGLRSKCAELQEKLDDTEKVRDQYRAQKLAMQAGGFVGPIVDEEDSTRTQLKEAVAKCRKQGRHLEEQRVRIQLLECHIDEESKAKDKFQRKLNTVNSRMSTASLSGWLEKANPRKFGGIRTWKKRYFMITENSLLYFENPTDEDPKGKILYNAMISVDEVKNDKAGLEFTISRSDKSRLYEFRCEQFEQRQNWMKALKSRLPPQSMSRTITSLLKNDC